MSSEKATDITENNRSNDSLDFDETISWSKELIEEKLPADIIFPEELNLHLRDRIRDLTAENGCLRRALEDAEEKIQNKCEIATTQTILRKPNEVAAAKIIELSKKCREQTAEVESLKTKCKHLEGSLAAKEAELENERSEGKRSKDNLSRESTEDQAKEDEERVKVLVEKLQQTQAKLYESKNTCATLKQEINKAQKLLCSEVGENVSINNLLNQPGGWRGRAEQIRLLQQKVSELQTKLTDYEGSQKGSIASLERKNLANLRNAEKERRQQIENSAKELRQAEVAIEGYKRKLEASKARIKVLEHELNVTKGSVAILNEKRSHDDQLIEKLNSRLKSAEMKYQEREMDTKNREEKFERESTNLKNELQSAILQIERLRKKLEEREIEIDKLRNGTIPNIETLRDRKFFQPEMHPSTGRQVSPPESCRSTCEPNEYVILALASEAERERLLELITMLNRRLDKERSDADILSESLRNERNRVGKLQLRLRKLETERMGIVKIDTGYRNKYSKSLKENEEFHNAEQARLKMELLEEECLALKARLDTVQQDKASDLALYKRTLDQVKKIFQDACRNKPLPTIGSRSTITI